MRSCLLYTRTHAPHHRIYDVHESSKGFGRFLLFGRGPDEMGGFEKEKNQPFEGSVEFALLYFSFFLISIVLFLFYGLT